MIAFDLAIGAQLAASVQNVVLGFSFVLLALPVILWPKR